MGFNWTAEAVEQLRTLVLRGASARAIGMELGTSRFAVIGKAHRIGLQLAKRKSGRPALPRAHREPRVRLSNKRLVPGFVPMAPEPDARNLTLLELQERDCRYPVTADSPFLFCGKGKAEGSSYCAHHHNVSIMGGE